MKKLIYLIVVLLSFNTNVLSQSPDLFKFQAVARNSQGTIISNDNVDIIVGIIKDEPNGIEVYNESHSVLTNQNGYVNLNIGAGQNSTGDFSSIDWSTGTYYIELTLNGNVLGTSQLLSVPYSKFADKANEDDPVFTESPSSGITTADIDFWNSKNLLIFESVDDMKNAQLNPGQFYKCKRYHANGAYVNDLNYIATSPGQGVQADGFGNHLCSNGNIAVLINDSKEINVLKLGVVNDGNIDNSQFEGKNYIQGAIDYVLNLSEKPAILFPSGTYKYSIAPNFAYEGFVLNGAGKRNTIFKYVGLEKEAFMLDATFKDTTKIELVYSIGLNNFTIEGNTNTKTLLYIRNCSHLNFENINVRNCSPEGSVGFDFNFTVKGNFKNLTCSKNEDPNFIQNMPEIGIYLHNSIRSGHNYFSSDNLFTNIIIEGCEVGVKLNMADQNTFIGGTSEGNTKYGVQIGEHLHYGYGNRYNTFIGVGFEHVKETVIADVVDYGISNKFINCYSSNRFIIKNEFCSIDGGYHNNIDIESTAKYTTLNNLYYSHWDDNAKIVNTGKSSTIKRVINSKTGELFLNKKPRKGIQVTGSPFTYKNNSYYPEQVVIRGGTVSYVEFKRGASSGDDTTVIGGNGSNLPENNIYIVLPGDELVVHYTVAPDMFTIPLTW